MILTDSELKDKINLTFLYLSVIKYFQFKIKISKKKKITLKNKQQQITTKINNFHLLSLIKKIIIQIK